MTVTLPIPNRNLVQYPLKDAEISAMLNAYMTSAQTNVATDPITAAFAKGLYGFVANRRILGTEISKAVSVPEVVLTDDNGNPSVILDGF